MTDAGEAHDGEAHDDEDPRTAARRTDRLGVADSTPADPARLPVGAVRPSQLYLSAAKLEAVVAGFDFDRPVEALARDPPSVFAHEGAWHLADGHHRAFAAVLAGADRLPVYHDPAVREEHDFAVYVACVDWCEGAGVESPADFAGRVLNHDTFETEWIDRCHRVADRPEPDDGAERPGTDDGNPGPDDGNPGPDDGNPDLDDADGPDPGGGAGGSPEGDAGE